MTRTTTTSLIMRLALACILGCAALPSAAPAGVLCARRPGTEAPVYNLAITHIRTQVTITGQLAVTHVDEEFYNDNALTLEGFYAFQLPEGARVNGLWLWENGQRKIFICLKKEDAERRYDSVVIGTRRDPALLESLGENRFQLKVFPIGPKSSRRVEIEYFHPLLLSTDGTVHYSYPLNLQGYQSTPVALTELHVSVTSFQRISNVSTSFDDNPMLCRVQRPDEHSADISFGLENQTYAKDFTLAFMPENIFGLFPALVWRDTSDVTADPYFMTWHPMREDISTTAPKRDLLFVLDASGSMDGARITAVRQAVINILRRLTADDRIRIVLFSTAAISFPADSSMLDATTGNIERAVQYIQSNYEAMGGTNYEGALRLAFATRFRIDAVPRMLFLTDGDPNAGAVTYDALMKVITACDTRGVPINPVLLYTPLVKMLYDIAQARGGRVTQVETGDDIEVIISRIMLDLTVVGFHNPAVSYLNGQTSRVLPDPFPVLTPADKIITTGRWTGGSNERATLSWLQSTGAPFSVTRDVDFAGSVVALPHVGKYWAAMMIDQLCAQIRLGGADTAELKKSVIQLSIKHNVLSPYTAFLVLETNKIDPPPTGIGAPAARVLALGAAYPNPFEPSVHAALSLPFDADEHAAVRIVITDVLGRTVRVITDGLHTQGHHILMWDGTDHAGRRVPSGTYFIRMTSGTFSAVRQVLVR